MNILLVEDHHDLAASIGEFLEGCGHTVLHAGDGVTGLHLAITRKFDAMILDLHLPGFDGVELCRRFRLEAKDAVAVLMLTASDSEADKLRAFDAGVDDYLTKPFSLRELDARLKALLRRRAGSYLPLLRVADLSFDTHTLEAHRAGRRISITPVGSRILEKLMRASPAVVLRREIVGAVWGGDPPEADASLRTHIHTLRHAIDDGHPEKLLHTLHSVGYRLGLDEADPSQ